MNLLDRIIGFVSPARGLRRARARAAMRIYEGASPGRRANSWRSQATSANTEIKQALGPLRDRARDLVRNTPHAARMLDIFTSHIIGTGIRPVSATGRDKLDDRVERLFKDWQDTADIEGVDSFYSLQRLALRSIIESGEVVIRLVDRTKQEATSPVPLHLQVLEGDFIDSTRDGIMGIGQPAGQRTRLGVGLGDYDVRTGLWLFNQHPGEQTSYVTAKDAYVSHFVASDQLIHLFGRNRPGQVRGISWFAPMITTARDFSDLMDAVTVKARIEACFAAFITQADDLDAPMEESANVQGPSADNPNAMGVTLEPGMMKLLRPGQDVKFAQPTSTSQIESVMMFDLMSMAAAVGVTYDQLSGDLRGANYSSLRAGKIDFRALCEQVQELILIPRVCNRIWKRFIERAILAGELADRKEGYPVEFITPAWQSINPKFDEDAEMRSVRAGRMTPQQYMAGWGGNWRRNIRAIKEFYEYLDEKEVAVEIDVRNYTRAGSHQPPQPGVVPGGTPTAPGESPPAANGAANGVAAANGKANGSAATVTLVDANGDPIDISDLQDLIDEAESRGIDIDSLPFQLKGGNGEIQPATLGAVARAASAKEPPKPALQARGEADDRTTTGTGKARRRTRKGARKKRDWNEEDHPRDQDGKFASGGGDGGGAGEASSPAPTATAPKEKTGKTPTAAAVAETASTAASTATVEAAKPAAAATSATAAAASPEPKEKKVKPEDFTKDKVELSSSITQDKAKTEKFIEQWDSKIGEAPGKFKEDFLGGIDSTMRIESYSENEISFSGSILGANGAKVGTYTRSIDFGSNTASSDYFAVTGGQTGKNIGKQVLASNVEMYQKLGIDAVKVHANIDVGGYAWAKYGYVPTQSSWRSFSSDIRDKIDELSGGGSSGYKPESWEEMSSTQQHDVEREWKASSFDEFLDSEIESWRESGQPLEDAKKELVEDFNPTSEWATEAIGKARETLGDTAIPYTNDQLLAAITLDYSSRYEDGKGDVDVSFDDEKLGAPTGYDPAQEALPGIEPAAPHEHLTDEMRDTISDAMSKAFDNEADSKAGDADPPDYLRDGVDDLQHDYWENMSDRDKYRYADDNGLIPESEDGGGGDGEIDESTADDLRSLVDSDDPKSVWAIADSAYGKELLLGTDWYGELDLHDSETMERFNAYVGKAKQAAA